jgi:hypothetical protein
METTNRGEPIGITRDDDPYRSGMKMVDGGGDGRTEI